MEALSKTCCPSHRVGPGGHAHSALRGTPRAVLAPWGERPAGLRTRATVLFGTGAVPHIRDAQPLRPLLGSWVTLRPAPEKRVVHYGVSDMFSGSRAAAYFFPLLLVFTIPLLLSHIKENIASHLNFLFVMRQGKNNKYAYWHLLGNLECKCKAPALYSG